MRAARIALPCLLLFGASFPALGATSAWLGTGDAIWDNPANWSAGVPTDIAELGASARNDLFASRGGTLNTLSILAGAPAYTIYGNGLTFIGAGFQNASANPLSIDSVYLKGAASAGTGTLILPRYGSLTFDERATAGTSNIQNEGGLIFMGNSTAGDATITASPESFTVFNDAASLGNATLVNQGHLSINSGVILGVPTITTEGSSGITQFSSSRGGGLTTFNTSNGATLIFDAASAGHATLNNSGGGRTTFVNGAFAQSAAIYNDNSLTAFNDTSDGGTAALFNVGASTLDITGVSRPGFKIGSISGSGVVLMGSHTMTVGGFNFDGNNLTTTFSGVLSGLNGSLKKAGPATLILSGANTYTGGTTIEGGTLRISTDNNLGAAGAGISFDSGGILGIGRGVASARPIELRGNGTIETGISSSDFSGRISGPGGLTVGGSGILTLSGQNDYTGGTTIDGATLRLAAPGSLPDGSRVTLTDTMGSTLDMGGNDLRLGSLVGDEEGQIIVGTATLTFAGNGTSSYSGTFSGTGRIVVDAMNLVSLITVSPSITTEVRNGALAGNTFGDVIISTGGYLFATESNVQLQNVVNRGRMHVGDPLGQGITAASYSGDGMIAFQNGFSGMNSTFTITGQANLTGSKLVFLQTGPRIDGDFKIIQAGSIVGRFEAVPYSSIFEQYQTVYSSSEVHLVTSIPGYTFSTFAVSGNQRAIARVLEASWRDGEFHNGWDVGEYPYAAASAAEAQLYYDLFGGDALASFQDVGLRHAASFMEVLQDRKEFAAAAIPSSGSVSTDRLWVQGVGSSDRTEAHTEIGSPASQTSTSGFQAGYDLLAGERLRFGISGGYLRSNLSIGERQFSGDSSSVESGVYASYADSGWFLDGAAAYIGSRNHGSRQLDALAATPGSLLVYAHSLNQTVTSHFESRTLSAMIEGGARLRPNSAISWEPTGSLRWSRLRQDPFLEDSSALIVDAQTVNSLLSSAGLRVIGTVGKDRAHPLQAALSMDWRHELAGTENAITARFDDNGPRFSVQATPRDRNAAVLGTDLRLAITRSLQGFFHYQFSAGDFQQSHTLNGGLRLQW